MNSDDVFEDGARLPRKLLFTLLSMIPEIQISEEHSKQWHGPLRVKRNETNRFVRTGGASTT